jgi:DNA polymerase (family X)
MTNAEIARVFEEIADLMEIRGDDSFRVSSYRRVARAIDDCGAEVAQLAARGELGELAGVGKSSAQKIDELLTTGRVALRDELEADVPPTLLEILKIPGLGPKKAALLWRERGVTSLASLKSAVESGKLANLKGFGEKSVAHIREGIEFLSRVAGRTRLGVAAVVADALRSAIAQIPGVERVECAGSLRRGVETVGDLDLLCIAKDGPGSVTVFTKLPGVQRVLASGDTKGSVLFEYAAGKSIQVDLRVVPAENFGAAWLYFTGSKSHNVRLRERAGKSGWTLNEYALTTLDGGKVIASREEADIYKACGLPWFPPELREDRGEFDLAAVPDDLLAHEDIRGDLHMHTTASDGRNTIEEMIAGARARGYAYLCITDHSRSSTIANGLTPERLREHIDSVRKVAAKTRDITVWIGAEVDILADGALDYDDELLAQLDWVVASVHSGQNRDVDHNTRRTLAAIANPYVNVIAHPTGRLLGKRDAMPLDIETLAREAARTGTALEINASTFRLDLKDQHARLARDLGAMICINCDAHSVEQFDQMTFGVCTARRAWLRRGDVLNTRSAAEIRKFVQKKRDAAGKRAK